MVELREVVPNRVLVVLPGWFFTIIISIWFLLLNLVCFAGRHQRAEGVTCGEMWQRTGEEVEVEVEEIDEEVDNMVVGKVDKQITNKKSSWRLSIQVECLGEGEVVEGERRGRSGPGGGPSQ